MAQVVVFPNEGSDKHKKGIHYMFLKVKKYVRIDMSVAHILIKVPHASSLDE